MHLYDAQLWLANAATGAYKTISGDGLLQWRKSIGKGRREEERMERNTFRCLNLSALKANVNDRNGNSARRTDPRHGENLCPTAPQLPAGFPRIY